MLTKFKRCMASLMALCLTVAFCASATSEADKAEGTNEPDRASILVVYPEEADLREGPDALSGIAQVLLSLQLDADYVEWRKLEDLTGYERVIWCDTAPAYPMDRSVLEGYKGRLLVLGRGKGWGSPDGDGAVPEQSTIGVATYQFPEGERFSASVPLLSRARFKHSSYISGLVEAGGEIYPLVSGRGRVRHIALMDYTTNFAKAVLTQEVSRWLWHYRARMHTYTEYLVLDHVYPFADPYRLRAVVERLAELKMSFVISVMPIYEHADYPAMEDFCEVLRYAQKCGGSVIMCAPLVQNGLDAEAVMEKLTTACVNYTEHGVYPLGLEIPGEWIFSEEARDILRRFRTLFIADMEDFASHSVKEYDLRDYYGLGMQQITPALKLDETGVSQIARCSTAVYIDFSDTADEQIMETIDAVKNSPIPVQNLWELTSQVYLDEGHVLTWDQNTLMVDGRQRFLTEEREKSTEPFDYKRNVYYRVIADLNNQNYLLIGISAVLLVVFILLGISSRRQMHKRFLRPDHKPDADRTKEGKDPC